VDALASVYTVQSVLSEECSYLDSQLFRGADLPSCSSASCHSYTQKQQQQQAYLPQQYPNYSYNHASTTYLCHALGQNESRCTHSCANDEERRHPEEIREQGSGDSREGAVLLSMNPL